MARKKNKPLPLKPQAGPQEAFLATSADIAIYGGAAGAGKTYAELLEPLRHINVKNFGAVIFRRESSQIANEGGPWDTAREMYEPLGATFVESPRYIARWKKRKVKITFSHMQLERHMYQWDGSQIPLICFDELQHFTEKQFWYMLSRNRSSCGIRPYVRGTCNPDPDSFLRILLAWWIYQTVDDIPADSDAVPGDPIPERSGVIRWLVRDKGKLYWGDSREELIEKFPKKRPKSFTFIMATLDDNPALKEVDPDYEGNIDALLDYEQKRLKGNWFARPTAGELFKRQYFDIIEPEDFDEADVVDAVRFWDRAATEVSEENDDPDWTAGLRLVYSAYGYYVITDIARDRVDPGGVVELMDNVTYSDGYGTDIGLEQEPGASGKIEAATHVNRYSSYSTFVYPKTKSKLTSWKPVAVAAKNHEIRILRGAWNKAFIDELEAVTDGTQKGHDDQADALAGAFNHLTNYDTGMKDIGISM